MLSERLVQWLGSLGQFDLAAAGTLAVLIFISSFVPVPRTLIIIGAGAAFGLRCLVVVLPVAVIASILAFLLSRYVLRGWVERWTAQRPGWRVLADAIDDEGWRIMALMRFWGPMPNSAQNYLFGLTRIAVLPYALITSLCTLPQMVFHAYLGASGRALLLDDDASWLSRILIVAALLTVAAVVLLISRRIRIILARKTAIAGVS
jgi:uncharacterized membrane protein YdjX (TVP38/TMEM64 family)